MNTTHTDSDMPVPYTAATAMATAWRQAIDLLRAGQSQIAQAEKLLAEAFMPKYSGLTFCHAIRNGNLHLEFKRADLLAKFNQIAGAGFVAPENEGSEA